VSRAALGCAFLVDVDKALGSTSITTSTTMVGSGISMEELRLSLLCSNFRVTRDWAQTHRNDALRQQLKEVEEELAEVSNCHLHQADVFPRLRVTQSLLYGLTDF
jgi:hypothetical protein